MSCPTHRVDDDPQKAVRPPREQATDNKLVPEIIASASEALLRRLRPGLTAREVVGDGVDRAEA
jgi:hypothetical protein